MLIHFVCSSSRRTLLKNSNVLAVCFFLNACATFDPATRYQEIMGPRQPTVSEAREGLQVSLEEFISSEKSRRIFDADLASHGVLALLLKAENKGQGTYKIEDKETRALLENQLLPLLPGVDAANQAATREYFSKAAGWTLATGPFALIFWPVTVSVSGMHTGEVNRRIEQHFETLSFGKAIVQPGQSAVGFLYFKLPERFDSKEKIIVEIVASEAQSASQIVFKLPISNVSLLVKN